ncbi:MAG: 16S rRNA (guanine(527)-N(7))-methyltransferase RsmG [Nitrospirales bacterium]
MEHQENTDEFLGFFVEGAKKLGFSFKEDILENFNLYYKELCFWNRSVNLTGLQTVKEQAVLLFADSLAGSLAFSENTSPSIIDIGTGAGFPGLPLKLAFPSLRTTLMEPRANKIAFLHTVIGKIDLTGISVLQKRLEACRSFINEEDKWDIAISKAVSLEVILPHVKNILKKHGRLAVFRSTNIENLENLQGLTIEKEIPYELPYEFGKRVLSVLKHVP